jgi:hypothetical protein
MGLTMAIQNSRTLAQKFATKNPNGKTETGAIAYSESRNIIQKNLEVRLLFELLNFVIVSGPTAVGIISPLRWRPRLPR